MVANAEALLYLSFSCAFAGQEDAAAPLSPAAADAPRRPSSPHVLPLSHHPTPPHAPLLLLLLFKVESRLEAEIKRAKTLEQSGNSAGAKAAWDNVEELGATASHLKATAKADYVDPLDQFCEGNPDADECR